MTRGSHSTWSKGDSRTCHHCGQTLRITRDTAIWIHTDDLNGRHSSSHAACGPPWDAQPPDAVKSPQTRKKVRSAAVTETPTEPAPDPDPQPDDDDDESGT